MVEEDFKEGDEEFKEDEDYEEEESEEELENIIEETDFTFSPSFRQAALEEIIPVLQPRGGQNLEQGVSNIPLIDQEEEDDQLVDYALSNQETSYDLGSDYQLNAGSYDLQTQTPDGSSAMNTNRIPDQFSDQPGMIGMRQESIEQNQGFQQKQYDTDTDNEKKLREDRKRF